MPGERTDLNQVQGFEERVEQLLFSAQDGWERARSAAQRPWDNGGRRSIPVQLDDDDIVVSAALTRGQRLEAAVRDALEHLAVLPPNLGTARHGLKRALRDSPGSSADSRDRAFSAIRSERDRQDQKWGQQDHDDRLWLGILVEEVGEVAKAIIDEQAADLDKELVQAAAVIVAWLECIQRRAGR